MSTDTQATMARTLAIVHRHAHDVRNQVNSIDLELTLLEQITRDSESRESVARLRTQLAAVEVAIKSLIVKFTDPEPFVVAAGDLLQLWKLQIAPLQGGGREIEWMASQEAASVRLDARCVVAGLAELTLAAWSRSAGQPLTASLVVTEGTLILRLREPQQRTALAADLVAEMGRLVTANGGRFEHVLDGTESPAWITSLILPLFKGD